MDRQLHWDVARTRSCQEKKAAEALSKLGVESFLPVQKVRRQWSDRVKTIASLLQPHIVFIRCTPQDRKPMLEAVYGLIGYMMDRGSSEKRVLIVPDSQMNDFMFVIGKMNGVAEVAMASEPIRKGGTVEFVAGPMKGFRCECVDIKGKKNIVVRLGMLGSAVVEVNADDLVAVNPDEASENGKQDRP